MTTLWKAIRANKEDRIAKLEWASNGGLGRVIIGKVSRNCATIAIGLTSDLSQNTLPMSDLVRPDPRASVSLSTYYFLSRPHLIFVRDLAYSTVQTVCNIDGGRAHPRVMSM